MSEQPKIDLDSFSKTATVKVTFSEGTLDGHSEEIEVLDLGGGIIPIPDAMANYTPDGKTEVYVRNHIAASEPGTYLYEFSPGTMPEDIIQS